MGMARKEKSVASTSAIYSLQRLKTLEKDHPSFAAQLDEVARILGQPNILETSYEQRRNGLPFAGKADWALRWITKKLGSEDGAGEEARNSAQVWNLLGNLLRILPVASTTQTLKVNRFLHSLEKALTHCTQSHERATDNGHAKHGSKRRKLSITNDKTTYGKPMVGSIARCIETLEGLARNAEDTGRSLDTEYLRSTLRTDSESAAKILRGFYVAQSQGYPGPVDPFLTIWNDRSEQANDDHIFAQTCLVAAICAPGFDQHAHSRQVTERLIARHVILPSRTAYHASKAGRESTQSELDLDHLMRPLAEYVNTNGDDSDRKFACAQIASRTLDIGIRSTSLDSTRKRAVEKSWFEALFTRMAFMAVAPSATAANETGSDIMFSLLRVAIRHRLQLSAGLLARIAREYTSWSIVSLLVQLDADVFVNAAHRDVSDQLWNAISQDYGNSSTDQTKDQTYESVKIDVVRPLMRAYASARKLPEFIGNWKTQLETCARTGNAQSVSVWQDTDLIWMLSDVLEPSLDADQILSILQELFSDIQSGSKDQLEYPPLSLINAVLSSIRSTRTIMHLATMISDIRRFCVTTLQSANTVMDRISRWRLYATCHTLQSEVAADAIVQDITKQELDLILTSVKEEISHQKGTKTSHEQALETLGVFMDNLNRRSMITFNDYTKSNGTSNQSKKSGTAPHLTQSGVRPDHVFMDLEAICSLLDRKLDKAETSNWWRVCASLLARHPLLLLSEDKTKGQRILSSIVQCSLEETTGDEDSSLMDLAMGLCRAGREEPLLLEHLRTLLHQETFSLSTLYQNNNILETSLLLLETIYLGLPANLIPRAFRERAIDAVCESIGSARSKLSARALVRRLSLAIHLLRLPHGGSSASSAVIPISKAVDAFVMEGNISSADISQLYGLLNEFCTSVFEGLIMGAQDGNNKATVTKVLEIIHNEIYSAKKKSKVPLGELIVAREVMKLNSSSLSEKPEWQPKLLDRIVQVSKNSGDYGTDLIWIEALVALISVFEKDVLVTARSTLRQLGQSTSSKPNQFNIAWMLVDLETSGGSKESLNLAFETLETKLNVEEYSLIQQTLTKSLGRIDADRLDELLEQTILNINRLGAQSMLGILFSTPKIDWAENSRIPGLIVISCKQLTLTNDIRSFEHIASTINSILQIKMKNFTQLAVESVLTSITILTSASSPDLPASNAALIHSRLTAIMVTLLTVHRRNLRSRFHLLLPALEGLLCCFFTTDSTIPLRARLQQPSWISQSQLAKSPTDRPQGSLALGPARAAALSRLLTLICEPSPSAVRSRPSTSFTASSNKTNLVDETTAARAYAGKYMGYFAIFLCECLLKGRFASAETRDALLQPGLWSVFSVVPKEVLEAQASAGVRGEGRAVLRGLLEEWRRAGGGRSARG